MVRTLTSIMEERKKEKMEELDKWYNEFKERFDKQFKIRKEEILNERLKEVKE